MTHEEHIVAMIATYIIGAIFTILAQVVLFRVGALNSSPDENDFSVGWTILGIAAFWPVAIVIAVGCYSVASLGHFARKKV